MTHPAATSDPTAKDQRAAGPPQRRAAAHAFRPSRTLPAVVTATVLAAAATLTSIETTAALLHHTAGVLPTAWLTRLGHDTRWSDPAALTAAATACLLGVLLITLALTPGRPRVIALTSPDPHTVIGITRSALRRHLAAAATGIDGIAHARVRVGRGHIRVNAASPLRDTRELSQQVHQAVTGRLQALAPLRPLPVRVTVRGRKD